MDDQKQILQRINTLLKEEMAKGKEPDVEKLQTLLSMTASIPKYKDWKLRISEDGTPEIVAD